MKPWNLESDIEIGRAFVDDPAAWLAAAMRQRKLRTLLAYADDGVIWGRLDDDRLRLSREVAPEVSPELRAVTLRECRLFGPAGELLLWRDDDRWRSRYLGDGGAVGEDAFDEDQLLWGDTVEETRNGFTLVREGAQGLRHAAPVIVTQEQMRAHALRLRVRHYIEHNADGEARIALSRLVAVLPETA